jgi:formylglycine-generating enzyme required for sulfatase activity
VLGSSGPASKLASSVVDFRVITVDEKGAITTVQDGHASAFEEDLSGVPLRMISIPAGTFKMGSPSTEQNSPQEQPDHEVKVPGFLLGQTEVTQAQWRAVAGWPKVKLDINPDPSSFKGSTLPVVNVSWDEAEEYCQRLARKTGRAYRLPSEAEWEYACRAGTTTPFHIGATLSPEMANYDGNSPYGSGPKGRYLGRTAPVGQYKAANRFGLYDMHGNVWEWLGDIWHNSYRGAPTDGSAWEAGEDPNYHVIRGGSWFNSADECRSASRNSAVKDGRYQRVGLRVALTVAGVN